MKPPGGGRACVLQYVGECPGSARPDVAAGVSSMQDAVRNGRRALEMVDKKQRVRSTREGSRRVHDAHSDARVQEGGASAYTTMPAARALARTKKNAGHAQENAGAHAARELLVRGEAGHARGQHEQKHTE